MAQRPHFMGRTDKGIGERRFFRFPDFGKHRFQDRIERLFAFARLPGAGDFGEDHVFGHVAALKRVLQRRDVIERRRDRILRNTLEGGEIGAEPVFHGAQQRHDMGAA